MAACSEEGYFQGVYEAEVCLQRGIIEALDREDGRLRGDDSFSSILVGEAGADYGLVYPGPSLALLQPLLFLPLSSSPPPSSLPVFKDEDHGGGMSSIRISCIVCCSSCTC